MQKHGPNWIETAYNGSSIEKKQYKIISQLLDDKQNTNSSFYDNESEILGPGNVIR